MLLPIVKSCRKHKTHRKCFTCRCGTIRTSLPTRTNIISHGQPKGPKNRKGFRWTRFKTRSEHMRQRQRSIPMRTSKQKNPRAGASGPGTEATRRTCQGWSSNLTALAATITTVRSLYLVIGREIQDQVTEKSKTRKCVKKSCQEIVSVNPYFYISSGASSKPLA